MNACITYRDIIGDDAVSNAPVLCRRLVIDLAGPGVLIVEQKGARHDRLRWMFASDFRAVELQRPDEHAVVRFPLADMARCVKSSSFIVGVRSRTFRDQDRVKIEAAEPRGQQQVDRPGRREHRQPGTSPVGPALPVIPRQPSGRHPAGAPLTAPHREDRGRADSAHRQSA